MFASIRLWCMSASSDFASVANASSISWFHLSHYTQRVRFDNLDPGTLSSQRRSTVVLTPVPPADFGFCWSWGFSGGSVAASRQGALY
jgi:hypothetical protein